MQAGLLEGLNEPQRLAVTADDGPLLIVAGPGSGKTRVLTHRIAYLLQARDVRPWRICAVTFTNKAARELKERLERLVGNDVHRLAVGTFHALCAQFLRQYGQELGLPRGFTIYDDDDQLGLVRQALKELDLDAKQNPPRGLLSGISAAKSQGLSPEDYGRQVESYRQELIARTYRIYQRLLDRSGALDFDDLLLRTVELLSLPGGEAAQRLPERFRYVLIDEYQDTNRMQFELSRRLASVHHNLCAVGDEDQSIYSWRGATIQNILDFETVYPAARVIKLEQNYRSTRSILRAAGAVIAENTQRKGKQLWTENGEGSAIVIKELYNEQQEAQFVVAEMQRLIEREGFQPSDIAILYRTNVQSRPLEEACARAGLPYQLIGGTRFYERREIKDVLALLRLILNPQDDAALRRVVEAMPIGRGLGVKTWQRLDAWAQAAELSVAGALAAWATPGASMAPPLTGQAARAVRALADLCVRLRAQVGQVDLPTLFDQALVESGYAGLLQSIEEPERWENVQALRTRLTDYQALPYETQLIDFLEDAALVADVDDLPSGSTRLLMITLHAAKGLEFPIVFMVGMEEGLLPHVRSLDSEHGLEEERRLAYVGITRARLRLYLTYAYQRSDYAGQPQPATRSTFLDAVESQEGVAGGLRAPHRRAVFGRAVASPMPAGGRPTSGGLVGAWPPVGRRPTTQSSSAPAGQSAAARRPTSRADFDDEGGAELVVAVQPGARVRHKVFGRGVVVAVTPTRGDIQVEVDFADVGRKKLMASLAHLEQA